MMHAENYRDKPVTAYSNILNIILFDKLSFGKYDGVVIRRNIPCILLYYYYKMYSATTIVLLLYDVGVKLL